MKGTYPLTKGIFFFLYLFFFYLFFFVVPSQLLFPGGSNQNTPVPDTPQDSREIPPQWTREFSTDFTKSNIDFSEILSGGPSKDGIPSIDSPRFVGISEAGQWIDPDEGVLVFEYRGIARIYPLQILMWHEIVNDTIGDYPIVITWCPLCNTAVGFERRLSDGRVLDFGTTGRLRFSNLLMYDRQTETWWQQAEGLGVIGQYSGTHLSIIPVLTLPFSQAAQNYPSAQVLSRTTGFSRAYGSNPYLNYDTSQAPFLYQGPEFDTSRPPMERALVVYVNNEPVAVAYSIIEEQKLISIDTQQEKILILWQGGVSSPLATNRVSGGPDRGSANAFFSRTLGGTNLKFLPYSAGSESGEPIFIDAQTGSRWNGSGRALSGPLENEQLTPAPTVQHFWFSASAFGSIKFETLGGFGLP